MTYPRLIVAAATLALSACVSLPENTGRSESQALHDTADTRLGKASQAARQGHPDQTGLLALPDGVDALLSRIVLAAGADRTLDVQYYIWHGDLTGRYLASALVGAADRGVRVRVLLDDIGANAKDEVLLALDSHRNIQVRLFNPIASRSFRSMGSLGDFSRLNRRMHNKAFIADNQFAILGGRNIGDEYFNASSTVGFGDLDVVAIGAVVPEVSAAFDQFWNAPASYPITTLLGREGDSSSLDALRAEFSSTLPAQAQNPYAQLSKARITELMAGGIRHVSWGTAQVLYDDPDKISRPPTDASGTLMTKARAIGLEAKQDLLIISPYFVPGDAGVARLREQVARGVRVTVLTNSLAATDVGAVHSGYQRYRMALLEAGVQLYEFKPGERSQQAPKQHGIHASRASLHAKTFVFDRRSVFIGSLNLDPRSIELNTEIGLLCESPELAAGIASGLERNLNGIAWRLQRVVSENGSERLVWIDNTDGKVREYDSEPGVSALRKFGVWFLGLLPIESQL